MIEINERSNSSVKTKSQFELDETLERLTKQVAKGGGIAFGGNVIGKASSFCLHLLLGRMLGPGVYGFYALGMSITQITQSIASLGLTQGVIRFCAMYRGEGDNARVKGIILSALLISLFTSMVITGIFFAFSHTIARKFFHEPDLTWIFRMLSLSVPFYVCMGIVTSFAQAFRRIEYQQGIQNIFRPLINLCLVGLVFLLGFRISGAVYGFLVSGVLSAGLGFYFLWKLFPEIVSHLRSVFEFKRLMRFSLLVFIAGFSYTSLHHTDRIMLGFFTTSSEVGIYNAASVISQQLSIFLLALVTIFSPIISDLYNRHQLEKLNYLYKLVSRWIFTASLPFVVIVSIFSRPIMGLFGSNFTDGWLVLDILIISQIIWFSMGGAGTILQMIGKQNLVFIDTAAMLFVNIGLNLWLIPLWGKLGAAIATTISVSAVEIVILIQVIRILRIHPFGRGHAKPIIAAILIAILGFVVSKF